MDMRNRSIARQALGEPTLYRDEDDDGNVRWFVRNTGAYATALNVEQQVDTWRPAHLSYGRGLVYLRNGQRVDLSLPAFFSWVTLIGLDVQGDGALYRVERIARTDPIDAIQR